MLRLFRSLGPRLRLWLRDHGSLQGLAILLIYIQIGSSMVGSLGALFNGILLVNMVAALFAIVAMEGSNQILMRTYGVLLSCMIFLDAAWFMFFSGTIWNFTYDENYGPFYVFSLRLAFSMQILGFSVRILSSLLWIQMYRLGPSNGNSVSYYEAFYRRSFLSPPTEDMARQSSDNIFCSYVRIASPYTPLFDDAQDKGYASEGEKQSNFYNGGLLSASEASQHASLNSRHFHVKDTIKMATSSSPVLKIFLTNCT